jgi:hypothetical protein
MAIAVFLDFPGVTEQQYDEVCRELNDGQPLTELAEWPEKGLLTHMSGPSTAAGWRSVDVWESEEAFGRFSQKLMPALEKVGVEAAEPMIFQIHKVITK